MSAVPSAQPPQRPAALLLGPSREAISGVTTHVNGLLHSPLRTAFALEHFQVGSEGRRESAPARLARYAFSPLALAVAILRRNAAIVHLNTSLNAKSYWRDLAYLVVAKLCGARVLLQKHGGTLQGFCGRNRFFAGFLRATLRMADAVVVLSRAELNEYEKLLGERTVVLLPNGIDCAPYRRYNRPPSDPSAPLKCIYIGRLAPRKGLEEILGALPATRATLVIAGSGPSEARLKLRARELKVEGRVRFAGAAYGEEKARLLSQADVLLLPSYSEGLPYALLEAMAAGVVPVVTRVGAIPDVVDAGAHGLFVPLRDAGAIAQALESLDTDRAWLARMSAACRQRVAGAYSIERVAADFSGLYAALLAPRAPKAVL
jgi:glycosyltransferase involved in cell wall biosynthesis